MTISIPWHCPRDREDCIALSNIISDDGGSFFCCGENRQARQTEQDKYTVCFKGQYDDRMAHYDKRDLIHQAAVLAQTIAVIEKDVSDEADWSPWDNLEEV